MKVALYYPWIYLTSGAERTILEMVRRSRHEWTVFTNRFDPENTFPGLRQCRVVELNRVSVRRSVGTVGAAAWRIVRQRLPLEGFDCLVVLCEGLGDLIMARNADLPSVCICLTPLRIAFDDAYRLRHGTERLWWQRAMVGAGVAAFRHVDRWLWRRYTRIMCISEETRRRAVHGRLAPATDLEVVPVGIGFEPDPAASTFGNFFLLPGRIMWTKNVELAISAFQRFRLSHPCGGQFRLVVAGIVDEKSRPYLACLREAAGEDSGIEFQVFPTDEELGELYRTCYAVLLTAFNEDWGIVALEAMAFGKAVVATDRGGPRETVLHGKTGFLEEPSVERFAARLEELATDPGRARSLGANGPPHARQFSWERFVARVDDSLDDVRASRRGPRRPAVGRARAFGAGRPCSCDL